MIDELTEIANGGPFDSNEAIRLLARFITTPVTINADDILADDSTDTPAALEDLIGKTTFDLLASYGYVTPSHVRVATDAQILDIPGIGAATLKTIREKVV